MYIISVYTAAGASPTRDIYQEYKVNFKSPLGSGFWGRVYKAKHKLRGQVVALKTVIWDEDLDISDLPYDPRREIEALRAIPQHPNIVRLLDHEILPSEMVVVMELCEAGHLGKYFVKHAPPMPVRVDLMEQASHGLLHLHSQTPKIVHRDIKPQNLLLQRESDHLVLKLADFGFATCMRGSRLGTVVGTPEYLAPEVPPKNEEVSYTEECDIFSLGLVLQAMARFRDGDLSLKPTIGTNCL